jgi:Peptidase M50B-like
MPEETPKPRRSLLGILWRLAASLVLIPIVAAMIWVFPAFLKLEIKPLIFREVKYIAIAFFSGAGVYMLLHIFLHRPITVYVFAHELTHALWAKVFGFKVRKIEVHKDSGRTLTDKSNWVVRLAPYCFPLYTLVWIALWAGLELAFPGMGRYRAALFFGIGFSYAFHVLLTLHFMNVGQSDLHSEGYVFSLSLILACNLELAAVVYAAIAHKATWLEFQRMIWKCLLSWGQAIIKL